jgi:streptogramin lyase
MFAFRALPRIPSSDRRIDLVPDWPRLPCIELNRVSGVGVDSLGRVYVAHRGEHPLLRLHPDGMLDREIGAAHLHQSIAWNLTGPTPVPMAQRYWLHGLHIDPWDNVWITDVSRHLVMKFDPEGVLQLTLGEDGVPGDGGEHFYQPTQVCVLPSGEFFVTDGYGNSRVAKFAADGTFLFDWGVRGTGPGEFHSPHGEAFGADGLLYVTDRENDRIQAFRPEDGSHVATWPELHSLDGLCASSDGSLWASAGIDRLVLRFDLSGAVQESWLLPDGVHYPHAIALGADGAIYLADTGDDWVVTGRLPEERSLTPRVTDGAGSAVHALRLF